MGNQTHTIAAQTTHDEIQCELKCSCVYCMHFRPTHSSTSIIHELMYDGCTMYPCQSHMECLFVPNIPTVKGETTRQHPHQLVSNMVSIPHEL